MKPHHRKVFGIGLQKTGTTTLKYALELLGYNVTGPNWGLVNKVQQNRFQKIFKFVEKYDAFQDEPWPHLYDYLNQTYPNSRFILTIRDEEKWLSSVKNFFGGKNHEYRRQIYGAPDPIGNESLYLEAYRNHNQNVKSYFYNDPEKLLVVNWKEETDIARLADFLEVPTPKTYITREPLAIPQVQKGHYSNLAKAKKKGKRSLIHFSINISPKIYKKFYTDLKKWFLFNVKWRI